MPEIARLTILLVESAPLVMRRIEVPVDIRLTDLHLAIQIAMGWQNYHMYEFRVSRSLAWGIVDKDWPIEGVHPASKAVLRDLLTSMNKRKKFEYLYDFGDDWLHEIKIDAIVEAETDVAYPRLLAAENRCPPEDCGGVYGYDCLQEALADPEHEMHAEMVEWHGEDFDPTAVDVAAIQAALAQLAQPRRRKRRTTD